MSKAYGFIEISGMTAATAALDAMCKAANTEMVTIERKWGGRLVTVIIRGDVSAVSAAIDAAKSHGIATPAACGVLAAPHPEVVRLIGKSEKRVKEL